MGKRKMVAQNYARALGNRGEPLVVSHTYDAKDNAQERQENAWRDDRWRAGFAGGGIFFCLLSSEERLVKQPRKKYVRPKIRVVRVREW